MAAARARICEDGSVPAHLAATTSREEFRQLAAEHRVVPVTRKVLADSETPLSAYRKLAANRPGTFLLESAENGRSWSRWSFIGAGAPSALTVRDGEAVWLGTVPQDAPTGGDPLEALQATLELLATAAPNQIKPGLPPLSGGMVGFFAYDLVRRLERLPELAVNDLRLPDMVMLLATDVAAVDHHEGTITLIANAVNWNGTDERVDWAYDDAIARLDVMTSALGQPLPSTVATFSRPEPRRRAQRTVEEYGAIVEYLVEQIAAGEAFQVVPSQRFEVDTDVDPIDVYRMLRVTNPSPYMYLLHIPNSDGATSFSIVGSSPEALVTVSDGRATTHPIAGTRWRGKTEEEDQLLEKDLLADDKERAEHLMLVDLGRNDLGRVCTPGTVRVEDYSHIERYSHVMHLVSTVTGLLSPGHTALDAVTACFPAGTLSGAPKVRAMELIEEVEKTRRGLYGGVVGYLDFAGNADFAIAIRTALMRNGTAYVQAGGGVVADSNGPYEYTEASNKARAVLSAIAAAETLAAPEFSPATMRAVERPELGVPPAAPGVPPACGGRPGGEAGD
jgi:anthranilate synthase component I